jgi:OPT family small oligopeptide transporter
MDKNHLSPHLGPAAFRRKSVESVIERRSSNDSEIIELEANRRLSVLSANARFDPNMPEDLQEHITEITEKHDLQREISLEQHLAEDSIYPEVRAAVRNYDEDVPVNTFRAWFLGIFFTLLLAAVNVIFSLRNPSITVSGLVAQLAAYPMGVGLAAILPTKKFKIFGKTCSLNPGPFNIKEHTLITVMASVAYSPAYATDIILSMQAKPFYNINFGLAFQFCLMFSTQIIGYGIAGLLRRYLVYPASMIWPTSLPTTMLLNTLHDHRAPNPAAVNGWKISRYRFFLFVALGAAAYYWIPGFLAQFLSVFVFVTWIKPNNVIVNKLFGGTTGLGMLPLGFDWSTISGYLGSPLMMPWFAIANTLVGVVMFYWILTPAIHFGGAMYGQYFPLVASGTFDNTGGHYKFLKIMDKTTNTLNVKAYKEYSPLFITSAFAMSYGLSFAAISALVVHTALYQREEIWARFKQSRERDDDIHNRLMAKYKECPEWWYQVIFVAMIVLSFVTALYWKTGMTWWTLALSLIIACVFALPIGMIQAISGIGVGLNVFTEFIIGYVTPGRPIAMVSDLFVCLTNSLDAVQVLRLHYHDPRTFFRL